VTVLPVDVERSQWETVLEPAAADLASASASADEQDEQGGQGGDGVPAASDVVGAVNVVTAMTAMTAAPPAALRPASTPVAAWPVRLGFSRISGLQQEAAQRIVAARAQAPFASPEDLARRAALDARQLALLAQADALLPLSGHRHQAAWQVAGVDTRATALLRSTRTQEAQAELAVPDTASTVLADYRATGLSLTSHPVALLRQQLAVFKVQPAAVLRHYPNGRLARASGLVTHRQRPGTAKGVVFVTLEDETGSVNVIVWPQVAEQQRRPLLGSTLLTVYGIWQCEGEVRHLIARTLVDHSALLGGLATASRNFR